MMTTLDKNLWRIVVAAACLLTSSLLAVAQTLTPADFADEGVTGQNHDLLGLQHNRFRLGTIANQVVIGIVNGDRLHGIGVIEQKQQRLIAMPARDRFHPLRCGETALHPRDPHRIVR